MFWTFFHIWGKGTILTWCFWKLCLVAKHQGTFSSLLLEGLSKHKTSNSISRGHR